MSNVDYLSHRDWMLEGWEKNFVDFHFCLYLLLSQQGSPWKKD